MYQGFSTAASNLGMTITLFLNFMGKMEVKIDKLILEMKNLANLVGYEVIKKEKLLDYILYEYESYEEYKAIQVQYNKNKIEDVWADEKTLRRVANLISNKTSKNPKILCHGARNGFEVNKLSNLLPYSKVIGTDISDNASDFGLIEWDFHDVNSDWVGNFDCIYSNSLDQSWKPQKALETWLSQLNENGMLIIELSESHSPFAASKMDPFGVRPKVFPYVLTSWFGERITICHTVELKGNVDNNAYLFEIRNVHD